jgi:hypothetical protein
MEATGKILLLLLLYKRTLLELLSLLSTSTCSRGSSRDLSSCFMWDVDVGSIKRAHSSFPPISRSTPVQSTVPVPIPHSDVANSCSSLQCIRHESVKYYVRPSYVVHVLLVTCTTRLPGTCMQNQYYQVQYLYDTRGTI